MLATTDYSSGNLGLRIVLPSAQLAPFVSTYYRTEVVGETVVEDWLPPEAANLRAGTGEIYEASVGGEALRPVPPAIISGPTDKVTHLRIARGRFWGIGLTPAGWARFVGLPASDFANRFRDIATCPTLGTLQEMLDALRPRADDTPAAIAHIEDCLTGLLGQPPIHEETIHAVHRAIVSDEADSVAEIAAMAGLNLRTFERACKRHFGFPPRVLLRRQRFLRSLAQFMLDPSMRWIETLDSHYCDQAHFIRDFRALMGMTPGDYAQRPHPIAGAAVAARSKAAGEAMQALHRPRPEGKSQTGL